MGSESNQISDGTSFQPAEPTLCANRCGFFGSAATMNLCSKCFRDLRTQEEQAASARVAVGKLMNQSQLQIETHVRASPASPEIHPPAAAEEEKKVVVSSHRCLSCKKKVGMMGFTCRCGSTFCGSHRYPEKHDCTFDFKAEGREAIAKDNPLVKADKMGSRI